MKVEIQTVQLIFNRTAGGYSSTSIAALRAGLEGRGARVLLSECGPGIDVAISGEASHICAVGGDGTVRHVASAVARCGRSVAMSIYPAGTVNLIHRELASPTNADQYAMRALCQEPVRLHHAAEINSTIFLACASVGPDSHAVAALSPALKRRIGRFAYLAAFLGTLVRWPRHEITLACDGREIVCEAFYVAKGRYFAGPWSFAPNASVKKPELHVIALRSASRIAYTRFIWAVLRGKPVEALPGVTAIACTLVTARSSSPLPVQADGDIVASLPAKLQLWSSPIAFR